MNEQQIQRELKEYFENLFNVFPQLKLTVDLNMTFTFISNRAEDYRKLEFDLLVHKNGRPFIIVEIKSRTFVEEIKDNTLISIAAPALKLTNASFYLFTDGNQFKLIDGTEFFNFSKIPKEGISDLFKRAPEFVEITKNKQYLFDTLKNGFIEIGLGDKWESVYGNFKPEDVFDFDENNSVYYFKGNPFDLDGLENIFFQSLLPEFTETTIFRYTTVSSLESMLKFNTFRMSGIVGMNDPTEVDYVDYLVYGWRQPLDEWTPEKVEEINSVFITSCSEKEKEDDLTLWRLYGDDSKGVSLKLKVNNDCIKQNMIVAKVSYGEKDGTHKQIDLIKKLAVEFNQFTSARFEFKTYHIWKHFFKPYQYEVEKEVRLLYIKNDDIKPIKEDWVITFGDKIFNPIVDFKLNAKGFPLEIQEIILGPNTPEKNVNKAQLAEYIRQLRLKPDYLISDLIVKISSINNYRKA
jgi:hypothetical protein